MSGLTYLITGANRGIGKGLLTTLVLRPNTTIIAGVRDVASATETLKSIPVGPGSKIIIVKIDSTVDNDAAAAVEELKTKYGITHIDVLLSNAGLLDIVAPVLETPADQVRKHFEVNTIAPLILLQAFKPLLDGSSSPKFLVITSSIGSIGKMAEIPVPFFAYGISKAAANYFVRKVSFENPKLISMAFNPGWVQTDMGTGAANQVGMADAPMTLEESIKGLVKLFDEASLEKTGTFTQAVTEESIPW
ncbi:probable aflatoxin biosynthesis ketoreductase nor-1 [Phialocephala subalpina]|uniref:Probable aflatoxin biosynthesis ketoreductase nor-1 n=1 Tax=Phialocephala subalpina TaxID=576137 RepID=A0A1L7XUM2_9HELO|nr:probable aflatoxin biosynthesis ketoreductase nor-1 [Phialocephala subalpina]